jgi:hypothetical protein
MKILTDKQIKRYLRFWTSNKKRLVNRAKSRLVRNYKRYGNKYPTDISGVMLHIC